MSQDTLRERLEKSLREMLAIHDDNVKQGRVRYVKGSYVHKAEKNARALLAECVTAARKDDHDGR